MVQPLVLGVDALWRDRRGKTIPASRPPDLGRPLYGFFDDRTRPAGKGYDVYEAELRAAAGVTSPVSQILHGYSGSSHPTSFADSSVRDAPAKGLAAMLNTKLPWAALARGDYDTLITGFWQSWPTSTWGWVTVNHEPENDAVRDDGTVIPAKPTDPEYVAWADANAPTWCDGVRRYIALAAPIIRARGLNVKVGGCLMDFSWDTTRWEWWRWWEGIAGVDKPQVTFGIDAYWKHIAVTGGGYRGADPKPKIETLLKVMRSAGIGSFSLWETAIDRRLRGDKTNLVVGTQETCATWWAAYRDYLDTIPEMDAVAYFHTPGGPASDQAWLDGPGTATYASICLDGRRLAA